MLATAVGVSVLALAAAAPASHVVDGELARVELSGAVYVKEAGPPPREIRVRVEADAVITSRGRALRLADLRPGERIMILCADKDGVHRAQRIKASQQGANRHGTR